MKVSRNWLQNFFDAPLPPAAALADALTFHAFEIDGIERVGDDDVLDVKVTPNRGHDCLSHRGIAKELSAILKRPLSPQKDPFTLPLDLSKKAEGVSVTIEDPALCRRYIAAHIVGVRVGPSPEWLKRSLEAIGQRSINNVVDATNLVMFNIGQPLHAFDAKRLGSLQLGVRRARAGEVLEALDKKFYELDESKLVITAADPSRQDAAEADRPVGIAGVKGGEADRIDADTTEIVLESATFDGATIRKAAQALKLRTDASARFEQGLSPQLAFHAMAQVVPLIQTIAGGEVAGFVDAYPAPQEPRYASVTVEKINAVLGTALTAAEAGEAFARLGLPYKEEAGVFEVQVPPERLDLELPEDLVEEVGRLTGYDRVAAASLPPFEGAVEINQNFAAAEMAREALVAEGYSEVYTSVFAEEGERTVANKVDGRAPYLRHSLIPGLTEALAKNKPNKDLLGLTEIKLFEIGAVWKDGKEILMLGTVSETQPAEEKPLTPAAAAVYASYPLSAAVSFKPFSRQPYIVRDVAFWTPAGTDEAALRGEIARQAGPLAVRVSLFDRFEKGGRVSLAYRIIFQSFDRTLTEAEANQNMAILSAFLVDKGFEIR